MNDITPQDITESVHLSLSDESLRNADINLNAYTVRDDDITDETEKTVIYNPKKYPDKAVDIMIRLPDGPSVEIYLDTHTREWRTSVNNQYSLSPDQMQQFFKTDLFKRIQSKLTENWPMSDRFYRGLIDAVMHKKVCFDNPEPKEIATEDAQFRKGNIDKSKAREKNAAGQQIRTNSGRYIVTFSDFGVTKKDQARYYCWPKLGCEMKWSQWNLADKVYDENKSNPMFVRMSFWHNEYEYGLNLGLRKEIDDNRGFFGYNLTLEPKVQWTTPQETDQMLQLSIVQGFLKECRRRIENYLNIPTDTIYQKINNPQKITKEQIEDTKKIIRMNLQLLRDPHSDRFIYD